MTLSSILRELGLNEKATFDNYTQAPSIRVLCVKWSKKLGYKYKTFTARDENGRRRLIVERIA